MRLAIILTWLVFGISPVFAESLGPDSGSLVIVGGGRMDPAIVKEFIHRAGGVDAPFVIIPTANLGEDWGDKYVAASFLARAGAKDVKVLHTRDRAVADTEEFVAPLQRAKGVWIGGGRQWRLADVYLNTRTQCELNQCLARGGVIGGSSAGATILGSYLVRGAPEGNEVMMAKGHEEGWGFLKAAAIDQHVIARKRENHLAEVIDAHPDLLGIGIDEATAIVVTANRFRVIGASRVVIHDKNYRPVEGPRYYLLSSGEEFDLCKRCKVAVEEK
ncbi:MAG: cyanophycinase [Planctomycetales bacterium]|nr:cyanophycinase [Planctomycetales bacterium]